MINKIDYFVGKTSSAKIDKMTWGYSTCSQDILNTDVFYIKDILQREKFRQKFAAQCLSEKEQLSLNSQIGSITKLNKINFPSFSDTSKKRMWQITHPDKIIKEDYEIWCEQFLCDFSVVVNFYNKEKDCDLDILTFLKKDDVCNLTLEQLTIAQKRVCNLDVSTVLNKHGCTLAASVYVVKNYCNLENNFKINKKECQLAHESFVKEYECDLNFNNFKFATKDFNNCYI